VNFKEVVYVAATIFISLVIRLTEIKASIIIELNGSIVSFFFLYLIPIGLHLKCVYFSNNGNTKGTEEEKKEVETSREEQGTNQIESERPTKT
jgi:sodium-coupled neutral amino acid transporter 9